MAQRSSWKFLGLINITRSVAEPTVWFALWLPRRSSDGRWAWEEIHLLSLAGNSHYVIINTRSLYLRGCQEAADRSPLPPFKKNSLQAKRYERIPKKLQGRPTAGRNGIKIKSKGCCTERKRVWKSRGRVGERAMATRLHSTGKTRLPLWK